MVYLDDPDTRRANMYYIKSSMQEALLSREEEKDLALRWRHDSDESALHKLIRAYTRLVISNASRFRGYGLPMGDLMQEGNVGLMQAAGRFDPDRDVRFSTYATWWIRSSMQDYVLRNWSIVRTGTTSAQKALFFNLRRLRARISDAPNGSMTSEGRAKVAAQLKVPLRDVETMESRICASDQSLQAAVSAESKTNFQDFLRDERPMPDQLVEENLDTKTRSHWLSQAIGALGEREKLIICQRRMVEDSVTLEELGRQLGISKERVRQLESRAMGKIRDFLLRHVDRPTDLLVGG